MKTHKSEISSLVKGNFDTKDIEELINQHKQEISAITHERQNTLAESMQPFIQEIPKEKILHYLESTENDYRSALEMHEQETEELSPIEDPEEPSDAQTARLMLRLLKNLQYAAHEALDLMIWEAIRTGALSMREVATEIGTSHVSLQRRTSEIRERFSPGI